MSRTWDGLPPPEWRDEDGWHWLGNAQGGDACWPERWYCFDQEWSGETTPAVARHHWRYLGPCLPPAEIAALSARAERAEAALHHVRCELAALRKKARVEAWREAIAA